MASLTPNELQILQRSRHLVTEAKNELRKKDEEIKKLKSSKGKGSSQDESLLKQLEQKNAIIAAKEKEIKGITEKLQELKPKLVHLVQTKQAVEKENEALRKGQGLPPRPATPPPAPAKGLSEADQKAVADIKSQVSEALAKFDSRGQELAGIKTKFLQLQSDNSTTALKGTIANQKLTIDKQSAVIFNQGWKDAAPPANVANAASGKMTADEEKTLKEQIKSALKRLDGNSCEVKALKTMIMNAAKPAEAAPKAVKQAAVKVHAAPLLPPTRAAAPAPAVSKETADLIAENRKLNKLVAQYQDRFDKIQTENQTERQKMIVQHEKKMQSMIENTTKLNTLVKSGAAGPGNAEFMKQVEAEKQAMREQFEKEMRSIKQNNQELLQKKGGGSGGANPAEIAGIKEIIKASLARNENMAKQFDGLKADLQNQGGNEQSNKDKVDEMTKLVAELKSQVSQPKTSQPPSKAFSLATWNNNQNKKEKKSAKQSEIDQQVKQAKVEAYDSWYQKYEPMPESERYVDPKDAAEDEIESSEAIDFDPLDMMTGADRKTWDGKVTQVAQKVDAPVVKKSLPPNVLAKINPAQAAKEEESSSEEVDFDPLDMMTGSDRKTWDGKVTQVAKIKEEESGTQDDDPSSEAVDFDPLDMMTGSDRKTWDGKVTQVAQKEAAPVVKSALPPNVMAKINPAQAPKEEESSSEAVDFDPMDMMTGGDRSTWDGKVTQVAQKVSAPVVESSPKPRSDDKSRMRSFSELSNLF